MNKNLYLKELKRNRKNLLIWMSIIVGFTFMVLSIYPYMAEMGNNMTQLLDSMPVEIQKAMGMDANTWSSILGFYSTYYGVYIVVLLSIYTTSTGATIISKEEKDKTAEFLLTKPISRQNIVISKLMALFTLCLIIYFVQVICAVLGVLLFSQNPVNWENFFLMHLGGFVLMIFFTCIGVLLSMFLQPKKNFMGMVVGITFGSYFVNAVSKSTDTTEWLGYFSPFHYMNFEITDPGYSFDYISGVIMLVMGIAMLLYSNKKYGKKDIAT
ncbi:MAG: ABC transporter permease [Crocinitomicaceae bacterium]|nr:ABC transporter permease [Crocinitomicaceae bacterium]